MSTAAPPSVKVGVVIAVKATLTLSIDSHSVDELNSSTLNRRTPFAVNGPVRV